MTFIQSKQKSTDDNKKHIWCIPLDVVLAFTFKNLVIDLLFELFLWNIKKNHLKCYTLIEIFIIVKILLLIKIKIKRFKNEIQLLNSRTCSSKKIQSINISATIFSEIFKISIHFLSNFITKIEGR